MSLTNTVDNALVSLVIPAYNAAGLIAETLDSVLAQTHPAIEIIVVDDGSTDSTPSVVEGYGSRVRLVRQPNSGGCSSPRNHGLRLATGRFVTFFDADDVMRPDKIATQVRFLETHPEVAVVLMDYRAFDEHGPAHETHFDSCVALRRVLTARPFDGVVSASVATEILITENYSIAGSPLYLRAFFDRVEAFDETLLASEDFDLAYRSARVAGMGVIDEVGFLRRIHATNMSKRTGHILTFKLASREKLLQSERREPHQRLLRKTVAEYHLNIAEFLGRQGDASAAAMRHVSSAIALGRVAPVRMLKCVVRTLIAVLRIGRVP